MTASAPSLAASARAARALARLLATSPIVGLSCASARRNVLGAMGRIVRAYARNEHKNDNIGVQVWLGACCHVGQASMFLIRRERSPRRSKREPGTLSV